MKKAPILWTGLLMLIKGEHTHFWREKEGGGQFDPEAGNLFTFLSVSGFCCIVVIFPGGHYHGDTSPEEVPLSVTVTHAHSF